MDGNDMLSSLLNDPEALQSAISMATSLLGGSGPASTSASAEPQPASEAASPYQSAAAAPPSFGSAPSYDPSADLMRKAMPVLSRIAQTGQTAVNPEKRNLLNAVKPFVGESVAVQIDHGMRLVSLARMAHAAMGQFGGQMSEGQPILPEEGRHV